MNEKLNLMAVTFMDSMGRYTKKDSIFFVLAKDEEEAFKMLKKSSGWDIPFETFENFHRRSGLDIAVNFYEATAYNTLINWSGVNEG